MNPHSQISQLKKSEDGTILVFVGIFLAVILGFVALSFDLGRIGITQTELQTYADSVALAAAGELDGNADAITRATSAAANLITDRQTFGTGDQTLSGADEYTLTFHETLPNSDLSAITAATVDPAAAAYARVVVNNRPVGLTFYAAFAGLTGRDGSDAVVSATAVAGFTQYACDVTPLMFCVPSPTFSADASIGNMILLRSGGSGAAWGPGDFGFLDPSRLLVDTAGPCAGLTGVNLDACLIGAVGSITQCFAQRGVDTEPGQKVGIEDAIFNVRFDIFKAIMNGKKNNPNYAPAPGVVKGIVPSGGGNCIGNSPQASPDTKGLPRDTCFGSSCSRYGDGDWATGRAAYVSTNFGATDPHPSALTRYEYYKAEIAAAGGGSTNTRILAAPRSETGRPMCSNQQSNDPDRRVVIAAGIDCTANPINGAEVNVPVKEFVKLFITEPVGSDGSSPPSLDFWVEIVGSAGGGSGAGGSGGIFRDVVQLYR